MEQNIYILIETGDIEILGVKVFKDKNKANETFEMCATENQVLELSDDLDKELEGTLRIAGDDVYCVQLIKKQILT